MKKDLTVESYEEKRHYKRYEYNSPMSLYRMDYQDQYYYAEMKDYSRGGLSLLSNEKLVVGQLVYLEMKNYDDNAAGPENAKVTVAVSSGFLPVHRRPIVMLKLHISMELSITNI